MERDTSSEHSEGINRRRFAKAAAAAALLFLPPTTELDAQQKLDPEPPTRPADLSAEDWDEVLARYQNLIRVYGSRLSAGEKQRSLHILTTNQHMLASIRSFVIQNSDPSACTLRLLP